MYPEDRVLVAVMNRSEDFLSAQQGWYRVPEKQAARGAFFEYVAFYFTAAFGEDRWAVYYYARILGHELATRRDLLPHQPDHSRAAERYYKLQLGPLQRREPPIVSCHWRRVTFIHTTWDRFVAAQEINDLFAEGGEFVDRLYHALREAGMTPERCYPLREAGITYLADLAVPCRRGVLAVSMADSATTTHVPRALLFSPEQIAGDLGGCLSLVHAEVDRRGGIRGGK